MIICILASDYKACTYCQRMSGPHLQEIFSNGSIYRLEGSINNYIVQLGILVECPCIAMKQQTYMLLTIIAGLRHRHPLSVVLPPS